MVWVRNVFIRMNLKTARGKSFEYKSNFYDFDVFTAVNTNSSLSGKLS